MNISVAAKILGQKRPLFDDWRVPIPPRSDSGRLTLRDLITLVVIEEVHAFQERQEQRRLAQVLSRAEIDQGAERGKVDPGEHDLQQPVDQDAAVSVALQAFEDGLYFVFIDDVQQETLDQTIFVAEDSHVMFVRLIALSGG